MNELATIFHMFKKTQLFFKFISKMCFTNLHIITLHLKAIILLCVFYMFHINQLFIINLCQKKKKIFLNEGRLYERFLSFFFFQIFIK
jgi:hypothetical protein